MIRFAANLSMLFGEVPFLDRFQLAKEHGFDAVEFLFPYDYTAAQLGERLREYDLQLKLFNLPPGDWNSGERGLAALPGRQQEFRQSVALALEYALALGVRKLHCMAGIAGAEEHCYRENLAYAAGLLQKHGIALLIEPLNPFSMPGYFLCNFYQAENIIKNIENLFLQFDVFHCQQIHGNIAYHLQHFGTITRHYQIAGAPERFEPNRGELNYAYILQKIDALGYTGAIGCEYIPQHGTVAGLDWRGEMER